MTKRFEECLNFILKWEGGYTPPQPGDPNPTNYGIIQKVYDSWRKSQGLPPKPVKQITMVEVKQIYWQHYWSPLNADLIPPPLDLALFDTAVNMGVGTAAKLLQRAINSLLPQNKWIKITAKIDYNTLNVIKSLEMKKLLNAFVERRIERYHAIAKAYPEKKRFLKGWLNRVNDLKKHIGLT